jgi:hypothetical protein
VTEGFDQETANKLGEKVLAANPAKSIQVQMHSLMSPLRTSAAIQSAMGKMMVARIADAILSTVKP